MADKIAGGEGSVALDSSGSPSPPVAVIQQLIDKQYKEWPSIDGKIGAEKIIDAIPDGWAKVRGRWVELERPVLHRNAYDFVEANWGALNEALCDGRILILPVDVDCICDDETTCALHAREN